MPPPQRLNIMPPLPPQGQFDPQITDVISRTFRTFFPDIKVYFYTKHTQKCLSFTEIEPKIHDTILTIVLHNLVYF